MEVQIRDVAAEATETPDIPLTIKRYAINNVLRCSRQFAVVMSLPGGTSLLSASIRPVCICSGAPVWCEQLCAPGCAGAL